MKSNVIFVFSDQHRAEATGYNNNPDVITPNLDKLFENSVNFSKTYSNNPVCCPYRATLMTGQRSLTHGVFVNDVCLGNSGVFIADAFKDAGYDTAYVGKWHIDGHGRSNYIPPERRRGFDFWRTLECTHDYNNSFYYADGQKKQEWEGYDAIAQTSCAINYIKDHSKDSPFFMVLSWGPPHDPYDSAPEEFQKLYEKDSLTLCQNVPAESIVLARQSLSGYYAHTTALDSQVGRLMDTLKSEGIYENTIFIYTSDHGNMLGSHGSVNKQQPWEESIHVPFLLQYPKLFEKAEFNHPFSSEDIMPTILGLCDINIPESVEGIDYSKFLIGNSDEIPDAVVIENIQPFAQWSRKIGGREFRGIRTVRYTYVKDLKGPWLLFDNQNDPYQMNNLCNNISYSELQMHLDRKLSTLLSNRNDEFLPGDEYLKKWGYMVDEDGAVPYIN